MDDLLASYASSDAEVASKEEAEDELECCEGEFLSCVGFASMCDNVFLLYVGKSDGRLISTMNACIDLSHDSQGESLFYLSS